MNDDYRLVTETITFDLACENKGRKLNLKKFNTSNLIPLCLAFIFSERLDHLINYLSMEGYIK